MFNTKWHTHGITRAHETNNERSLVFHHLGCSLLHFLIHSFIHLTFLVNFITELTVIGIPKILERVCESVEIDELVIEQGVDCFIFLEALNHVEDDENENGNGNRTLHRLPCSHLFHSHGISEWFHKNLSYSTCKTPFRLK
jgi:hypothetical protein